ncbi:AAA family ATPase [Pseudomonas fulva]|uniref:AAA family ATPase n=1 Tax=Pseudomonas fulva TaxID=47880 RepID=UPI0018AC8D69|nr:AAA family ATPase [Pseudomonas fulva]MBF8675193.1 AAA family ATPase [Pseudomonas fulva]MBF8697299.1 AAA family ATPase [Pseudomonas fulva]
MTELAQIASQLAALKEKAILIYAFNATGKTRLSVAYKNATKNEDGNHAGVYYNAFSEDLFVWDNDHQNDEENVRLIIRYSSLNRFHASLTEENVHDILKPYHPKFDFRFTSNENPEKGIESVAFYRANAEGDDVDRKIKISRGEERIFSWCFFLALFKVEGWADKQAGHFFIDDPVSSLDDHNIFVTASTLYDLIEEHHENRKIIITTHHIGIFSILADWLTKGEKSSRYKKLTKLYLMKSGAAGGTSLESPQNDVFLYHLRLLQILKKAQEDDNVSAYHFALLRQVLENISSFLGVGQFGYVLQQIGIENKEEVANIVNALSHKKVYYPESDQLVPDNRKTFDLVLGRITDKYNFVLHAG